LVQLEAINLIEEICCSDGCNCKPSDVSLDSTN